MLLGFEMLVPSIVHVVLLYRSNAGLLKSYPTLRDFKPRVRQSASEDEEYRHCHLQVTTTETFLSHFSVYDLIHFILNFTFSEFINSTP